LALNTIHEINSEGAQQFLCQCFCKGDQIGFVPCTIIITAEGLSGQCSWAFEEEEQECHVLWSIYIAELLVKKSDVGAKYHICFIYQEVQEFKGQALVPFNLFVESDCQDSFFAVEINKW
jgi:hypothetical protein